MNKTALVTGTTSGIGCELCHELASRKINLVLVSRNQERLRQQALELENEFDIKVTHIVQDLTKKDSAKLINEHLVKEQIVIDFLVNNAGFNEVGNFLTTDLEKEIDMINLHIIFVTELTKYLLPSMIKRKSGNILNVASTGAYIPCPNDTVYTATKSYILFFSKGLASELKGTGVSITTVCPGATKTEFAKKAGIDNSLLFRIMVMNARKVARKSISAMMKNKEIKIIGIYNQVLVFSSYILPNWVVNSIGKKMIE